MESTYSQPPSEAQQPPGYSGSYPHSSYNASRLPQSMATNTSAPGNHEAWNTSHMPFPPAPLPGVETFGGPPPMPFPFDPFVPPPPFGCLPPPPGFPPGPTPGPPPFTRPNYGAGYGFQQSSHNQGYREFSGTSANSFRAKDRDLGAAFVSQPEDQTTIQRKEDEKWIKQFIESKKRLTKNVQCPQHQQISVTDMKNCLYKTAELVSQMSTLCEGLKVNVDDQTAWTDSYSKGLEMKREIQDNLKMLSDKEALHRLKTKLSSIAKRRSQRLRARNHLQMESQHREAQKAEKDAAIEKWRMKQIHTEEEKKKEQELKLAADSVLSEVRKKQADVKRMQDVLKSLEKLRKLRKEAALRKGISTEQESDNAFDNLLEKLRSVAKKRMVVYAAEEKALMVMLEGEQQEERRRDLERRQKKEREKQLQKKQQIDVMLFGDEIPADPLMQPFRHYYTQAQQSFTALVQIRREWDVFLVAADHPEGSAVPQGWVLPDPPSDPAWASALQTSYAECENI